ncbi:MAG TPA: PDR/VanB family oxidoreductase [Aliidongia sp.]|uniref:PDR/VanB family oxidoreductase n=1 Tax=Aliidongia sp. TaxID=1914230 RepID=UPI002DDCBA5C|nr:PDR/VanB family oxidoreductase [Aliidongia sp.]HEV2676302.1 PDR/VanB family oxidoreductase [Aliidongia sp.]
MQADGRQVRVRVRAIHEPARDVRLFELVPETGAATPYPAGSHLTVMLSDGLARSYSLIGEEPTDGAWWIAVKRVVPSRGGSAAMWALEAGAILTVTEPRSHFDLALGRPDYLLIAGGIGITPLVGMAERLVRLGHRPRLIYAARSRDQMAFIDRLQPLLGDGLTLIVDDEGGSLDLAGEITRLHADGEIYMCGPAGMMAAAQAAWQQAGRLPTRLRFETFGSSGNRPAVPFTVHVRDHGRDVLVPADRSLLDALADEGIELAYDCLRGECGLCVVEVAAPASAIDHRDVFLSAHQKQAGARLCACVSRADGKITIDTGYRPALTRVG